jgi:hypothetical protein
LERSNADQMEGFWGVGVTTGLLWHAGRFCNWLGRQPFGQGDTLGLLLDCEAGRLVVYKNNLLLGVAATGLTGQLCWAAALGGDRGSVSITGKLPPLGWRDSLKMLSDENRTATKFPAAKIEAIQDGCAMDVVIQKVI